MPEPDNQGVSIRPRLATAAAAALLAANVIVPFLWGDVYPFTSAPMFRGRIAAPMAATTPVAQGEETLSVTVNVSWAIKAAQ